MEDLKVFDDTQPEVVELAETEPDTGVSGLQGNDLQEQELAEPGMEQQSEQSQMENARFAEVRRRAEVEAKEKTVAEIDRQIAETFGEQVNPYTGRHITSFAEYQSYLSGVKVEQKAQENGITYEKQQEIFEELKREIKESDPDFLRTKEENKQLRSRIIDKMKDDDLAAILKHNPKEKVKRVEDFGDLFLTLRGSGIPAVEAYMAVCTVNARKAPPPGMGDLSLTPDTAHKNKYADMSDADFEKMVTAAQRGELKG